jgi:hypothetical protein
MNIHAEAEPDCDAANYSSNSQYSHMKTNELHYLTQQRLPFVQVQKSEI